MDEATMKPVRVLVVEDHHLVRQGLVTLLSGMNGIDVVGEAADGVRAIEQFARHRPDVTLIDLQMPRMDGVEVIRHVRAETPQARFVVLTTNDGDEDIFRALSAGARAYLLKGVAAPVLEKAIRTIHAGDFFVPPEIAQRVSGRMSAEEFSAREPHALHEIVRGTSSEEIAVES